MFINEIKDTSKKLPNKQECRRHHMDDDINTKHDEPEIRNYLTMTEKVCGGMTIKYGKIYIRN